MSVHRIAATILPIIGIMPVYAQAQQAESLSSTATVEYSLGALALAPPSLAEEELLPQEPETSYDLRLRLPEPRYMREETNILRSELIGSLLVFRDADPIDGEEGFHLGTALTRGPATAGVSLRYLGEDNELAQSDIFLDYALSDTIMIGITGTVANRDGDGSEHENLLGINAAYATKNGGFFQGSISEAAETKPVFGMAIGLRF